MKKVTLGQTGIEVSELAYGSLILGRLQANLTAGEAAPVLFKAVESGITLYDTAQTYGTQKHLGLGLGQAINDVVISSKTPSRTRSEAQAAFDQALEELNRDYIDIYMMHLIDNADDLGQRREVKQLFLELKQKGLIRALGASVHKIEAAHIVADDPDIDLLFPVINSQGMGIIDGTADEMLEAIDRAKQNHQAVMAMKPLAGGHLRESARESFDYLRDTGLIDCICVGMKTPAEVEMNTALFNGLKVPPEVLSNVDTTSRYLRIYARCTGCGDCIETCDQGALVIDYSQTNEAAGKEGQSVVDQSKCILCGYCAEVCPTFSIRVI